MKSRLLMMTSCRETVGRPAWTGGRRPLPAAASLVAPRETGRILALRDFQIHPVVGLSPLVVHSIGSLRLRRFGIIPRTSLPRRPPVFFSPPKTAPEISTRHGRPDRYRVRSLTVRQEFLRRRLLRRLWLSSTRANQCPRRGDIPTVA